MDSSHANTLAGAIIRIADAIEISGTTTAGIEEVNIADGLVLVARSITRLAEAIEKR